VEVTEPEQEDWGWYIEATYQGGGYFVGVGGNADEAGGNQGEWRIMVEKRCSTWERLAGKSDMSEADDLMVVLREILTTESDIQNVRSE
jgi:hypothetical protein